jgi:hypothetical protein
MISPNGVTRFCFGIAMLKKFVEVNLQGNCHSARIFFNSSNALDAKKIPPE